MCARSMDDTGLTGFNSARENRKSQNLAILDPKDGDFGPLSQKKQYERTHGHTVRYWRRPEVFNTVLGLCGTGG
jgi:hypothetical protein